MPPLSRWSIRAALGYLALGFTLGALILAAKGVALPAWLWRWLPAHIEFLMIGWTAQLVMGVGFWILPRFSHGPARGNEPAAWLAIVLLNAGIWLVALGSLLGAPPAAVPAGRAAEAGAALAFAVHVWPRVKPAGA